MNVKDLGQIRELAALLNETGLTEIEIEQNGTRLRVARGTTQVVSHAAPVAAAPATASTEAPKPSGPAAGAVPSPMVGTVYISPEPGKPPFVKVGDTVKEGATLLIIEAMKTMNPILAPRSGTVKEICIADAQPVEFGQSLLILA
jgi:acetyl-CoA carboxylase biotin carboxyl carrier protein